MRTIALRFGETFSPSCGTISAHEKIIEKNGFVWYGKLGSVVSKPIIEIMLKNKDPKFLLIKSGKFDRYWVHFSEVSNHRPASNEYPDYYGEKVDAMKTWFKVTLFEKAERDVMSHCFVASSGNPLNQTSQHSMSPYFIIEYKEDEK